MKKVSIIATKPVITVELTQEEVMGLRELVGEFSLIQLRKLGLPNNLGLAVQGLYTTLGDICKELEQYQ